MQFGIIDSAQMKITHDDKPPIIASIREFVRTRFINDSSEELDQFKEINLFFNTLSQADQLKIYNAYKAIFDELQIGAFDIETINKVANDNFKIIYNIVIVDKIQEFMEKNDLFDIPPKIEANYTGEYSEDRTYIIPKYKGLIALAIAGRMAIPVWGEFSPIRKNAVGSKRIPIPLLKMLDGTTLMESTQFKDLERYSNATVDAGSFDPGRIVAGFGTEYNKDLNLASNFVRKVAIAANSAKSALAENIYNYIANQGAYNRDASSGDMVWKKKDPSQEEEKSKWEKYNLRESISQGDICMIEHYLSNIPNTLERMLGKALKDDPKRLENLTNIALDIGEHLDSVNFTPTPENLRLAQWMLPTIVPPKTLAYVGYHYQRCALATTVAILVYLDYPLLAALVISEVSISNDGYIVSFKVNRKQMPEELEAELDKLYPTFKKTKDKEGGNFAKQAINRLYTAVNNSVLKVIAPPHFISFLVKKEVLNKHLRFSVQPETPNQLGQLLLDIYKLQQTN